VENNTTNGTIYLLRYLTIHTVTYDTTAAAEDMGIEETDVDRPRPTPGSSSHDDEYMEVNHRNRVSDHEYRELNAKQSHMIRMQSSPTYANLPHPSFSTDDHVTYENHRGAVAVDDPDNRLYVNVKRR